MVTWGFALIVWLLDLLGASLGILLSHSSMFFASALYRVALRLADSSVSRSGRAFRYVFTTVGTCT